MTLPLDDRAARRLAVVRQLFLTAEVSARDRGNPVAGMMAIVGLDLAAESLLKAFLASAGPGHGFDVAFADLLKKSDELLKQKGLPGLAFAPRLRHLHNGRNSVQHDARFPHAQEVDDARVYVHGFCQTFVRDVWGTDFDRISLVDLIQDELTRRVLHQAEDDIAAGNLLRGLALAYHAFLSTCDFPFLRDFFSGGFLSSSVPGLTPQAHREITNGLKMARHDAVTVSGMMAATSSLGDLNRLLYMVPLIDAGVSGDKDSVTHTLGIEWQHPVPDESAARWGLNFVVNSIVSWQQQGLPAKIANRKDYVVLAEHMTIWDEQTRVMRLERPK